VVIGGAPALLQALLAGSIQTTALSPPTIIVARDKFKVNNDGNISHVEVRFYCQQRVDRQRNGDFAEG
jgi:hypothetical protein